MLGAFRQFGELSAEGAVQLRKTAMERGISAAQLQRPEDIIAFQAMRREGMSTLDTQLAMERNPLLVNQRVFEFIEETTGGRDAAIRKAQRFLGGTFSGAEAWYETMQGTKGMEPDEILKALESISWGKEDEEVRGVFAIRQAELLKGIEDSFLDMTTRGAEGVLEVLRNEKISVNALSVTWAGYEGRAPEYAPTTISTDLSRTIVGAKEKSLRGTGTKGFAGVRDWGNVGNEEYVWSDVYEIGAKNLIDQARRSIPVDTEPNERRALLARLEEIEQYNLSGRTVRSVDSEERMVRLLEEVVKLLDEDFVFTDGE
jgi:hypothetical protein